MKSMIFQGLCIQADIFHQLGQFEKSLLVWHRLKKIRPRSNMVGWGIAWFPNPIAVVTFSKSDGDPVLFRHSLPIFIQNLPKRACSFLIIRKATWSDEVTSYLNHLQVQQSIESLRNRITSSLQNCFDAEDIKSLVKVLLAHFTIAKNCQGLSNLDIVGTKIIKESFTGFGAALWKCGRVHRE